ncbi:MAG: hypothetical protein GX640_21605 [Fibrobacter sp.]|nr:hypothetical protein [Fibrobacter sp.]
MNTVGVKNSDAWAQFMKLTQDARVRNTSLSNVQKTSSTKSGGILQATPRSVIGNMELYRTKQPQTKSPVLGGRFDAYA